MKLLFINPAEFFRSYDDKSWIRVLSIVGGITIILTLIQYFLVSATTEISPEFSEAAQNAAKTPKEALSLVFFMVLVALTLVFISTTQYYILTRILGGKIKFAMLTAVYSTAFVVTMIGDIFMVLLNMTPIKLPSLNLDPYLMTVVGQLDLFNLWSLLLMFFGIKVFSGLSSKRSAAIVILMVIGKILYNFGLISLSQSLG
jgi:hypothetical protein